MVGTMRVGVWSHGAASCRVEPAKLPDGLRSRVMGVSHVYVDPAERGRGDASGLLRMVCAAADEAGMALMVHVAHYGDEPGMSRTQLAEWYARRGFDPIQAGPLVMVRLPGAAPRVSLSPVCVAVRAL